jgi:hypothetical protein
MKTAWLGGAVLLVVAAVIALAFFVAPDGAEPLLAIAAIVTATSGLVAAIHRFKK